MLILSSVLIIMPSSPASATYTEIEIIPTYHDGEYVVNETIVLSIYVTPQTNTTIDTVSTDLITFTPSILQCTNISLGNLFSEETVRKKGKINNTVGTITDMTWGSEVPTNTSGYFMNLTFKIINPGFGTVIIDTDEAGVARFGNPLPFVITHNFTVDTYSLSIYDEYPVNGTGDNPTHLALGISVNSSNNFDIYWNSNATGVWKLLGTDENLTTGRHYMSVYGVIESPYNQELTYQCTDYSSQIYHANSCLGKNLGTITEVMLHTTSSGTIRPIVGGWLDGQSYSVSGDTETDITSDEHAPTQWTWDDIENLDVYSTAGSVEIIVVYDLGFGEGEKIYWSVNVTDGMMWVNQTYSYTTEIKSPVISNPTPYDSQIWLTYYPTLSVDVSDPNGDTMDVSFYWFNGTDWLQLGLTQNGGNGTYYQATTFAEYSELYYWYAYVDDGVYNTSKTFRFTMRDLQDPPYSFSADAYCSGQINISWVKPDYVDYVRIQRRPDHYPVSIDDGLNIYNGTDVSVVDVIVNPGTEYFYSAWSYNSTDKTWNTESSSALEITAPDSPTGLNAVTVDYDTINLFWTKGIGSNHTLIRRKIGSYPTNPTNGTFVYEGTGTSYVNNGLGSNITYYYTAWAQKTGSVYTEYWVNEGSITGGKTAYCNPSNYQSHYASQTFVLPMGTALNCTQISLYMGHSTTGISAKCAVYLNGVQMGLFSGMGANSWRNCTVPNVLLRGGETNTIMIYAYLSPYNEHFHPYVTWSTNINGALYKVNGYFGHYSCGTSQDFSKTDVGPPQVTTDGVSSIEDNTARLIGYLDADGGESTTCGFIWSNSSGAQNTTIGLYTMGSSYYLDASGLNKATTYTFRAWAKNLYGFVWGYTLTFNTKPYSPTNLTATDVQYNSINLSWDKGLGADKTVVMMKLGSYPTSPYDGTEIANTPNEWAVASSLSGNTTYFFRAWSYNETEDFFSNNYDGITQKTIVGEPVVNSLYPSGIGDTNATLRATLVDGRGESCSCGFRWGSSPGVYTNNATVGTYSSGQTFVKGIGSLSKGNTYYYQSWAKNIGGFSNDTEESFATKPVEPNSFTANNYGARQINLSWSKGLGADKTRIQRKIGSYPISTMDGTNIYEGTASSYNNVGLNENTVYYYRTWSLNNTNGLYSTLNVSAYDTTDWLPNITYMSPCGVDNINRPIEFSGSGQDDNPLTYKFYHLIGEDDKRLADTVQGDGWTELDKALNYGGGSADYSRVATGGGFWSSVSCSLLYFNYSKPVITSEIVVSFSSNIIQPGVERIWYHDYYNDTWNLIQRDWIGYGGGAWIHSFSFSPTMVDNVAFQVTGSHRRTWTYYVDVDYLYLYNEKTEIYETSAISNQIKNYTWISSTRGLAVYAENYTHWWQFEVSNGIDLVYQNCSFTTEKMTISSASPYDGETVQNTPSHTCSVQVNHSSGDIMDVYFYYYNSSFILGGQNLSVGNSSHSWIYPDSNDFSTTYYWKVCIWDDYDWHNETFSFVVRNTYTPNPPNYNLNNVNATVISITGITWHAYSDSVMMRFKLGSYPTSRTDGTMLFNATPTSYNHVGLSPNTAYYYSAWSWNETDNVWGSPQSKTLTTLGPKPPTFSLAKVNSTSIHITGIGFTDIYSDTILIRAKIGSYPTSRTDGIFVMNSTASSMYHTGLTPSSNYYYSAWAYDVQTHWWSDPTQHSQKTNGPPTAGSFYPSGQITGINPTLSALVGDYNAEDTENVYFRTNSSGLWTTIYTSLGGGQHTYTYPETIFNYQDWNYWWSVNVYDGEYWTNNTIAFRTGSMPVPTVTATTYNTTQINLTWTAVDSTYTYIVRKIDNYPVNRADGTNIYNGTGTSFMDDEREPGELCRYRVWSYNSTTNAYSTATTTSQALTKPVRPVNFTAEKTGYRTINLSWVKGNGSQKTYIVYKEDSYPLNRGDGTLVYFDTGMNYIVGCLKPDDYLNYYTPLSGTNNFGTLGDPFTNSYDGNEATKWDLTWSKTGNFSYALGIESQRVKGFRLLFQDFYGESGVDWNSAITKYEVYNGTWNTEWTGNHYNTGLNPEWWTYTSSLVYANVSQFRFNAFTEWITPNIFEVAIGKLGYVHCFNAWSYVTKGGLEQYSSDYDEAQNRTDDTPPNRVPLISNMHPLNGTLNVNPNPSFNVTIADPEGLLMNISWQYYNGSQWVEFDTTTLVGNGTYSVSPTGFFIGYNTTYDWRVNVSDTADVGDSAIQTNMNTSDILWFRTREIYIPPVPTYLNATTMGYYEINLTFTYTADKIYIERKTTSTWTRGTGTLVYNGTGTWYLNGGLNDETNYYYRAWGYNATDHTYSLTSIMDNATTLKSPNDPPNQPTNPQPTNNSPYIDVYLYLNCTVSDPNGDSLNVSYYWSDDTYIGTVYNVANNTKASLQLIPWANHDITYYWYVTVNDGEDTVQGPTWNFKTCKAWDLNVDKTINYLDVSILVSKYLQSVTPAGSKSWDINDDGICNYLDVSSLISHYLQSY